MADGRIPLTNETTVADAQPGTPHTPASSVSDTIEVPYNDYSREHGKPYIADHFSLGDSWNDPQGGFPREVQQIEGYIFNKIESGEVANSVTAVKDLLKGMEKFNNLNHEERAVVKIEVLAHYVEFLQANERTKANLKKYHG